VIPEPSSLALLVGGVAPLLALLRRRREEEGRIVPRRSES